MFNPQYQLVITTESFPSARFICLGSQLISIVNFLKNILPAHTWYGADVKANGKAVPSLEINGFRLNLIGSDQQLIQYCSGINQFIWGVFLCMDSKCSSQNIRNVELETEDEPFHPIAVEGILVEIRMFDTSYIEIYSEDEEMMRKISDNFKFSKLTSKPT